MDPVRSGPSLGTTVGTALEFTRPEPTWLSYIYRPVTECGSNGTVVPVTLVMLFPLQRSLDLNLTRFDNYR